MLIAISKRKNVFMAIVIFCVLCNIINYCLLIRNKLICSQIIKISCGTVGRAVASDIGGPMFESSHKQIL